MIGRSHIYKGEFATCGIPSGRELQDFYHQKEGILLGLHTR